MAITGQDWLQAQYSVLGAALLDPSLVPKILSQTRDQDYTAACKTIYDAMRRLFAAGMPVDIVTLADTLGGSYRDTLVQLMEITPTAANIDHYITLCREQARVLLAQDIGKRMAEAQSSKDQRALIEEAGTLLQDKQRLQISTMADALRSFMERHSGNVEYVHWPVRELDDRLYVELGDFVVIAGYPSAGKSAWALQCAWKWAQEYKVGFFSLETSSEKLFDRQMASIADISMDDIKRNTLSQEDWERVAQINPRIISANLELIPAAGMGAADVRAIAVMRGYQIVFVDYLQLLQGAGGNRAEQVAGISMALHIMAQDMGVLVVALSQLRRRQDGQAPTMSDLRESGQIEQDADVIQILSLDQKDQKSAAPRGLRVLKIAKNKEGTCPSILLDFDGKRQVFAKANTSASVASQMAAVGRKAQIYKTAMPEDMEQLPMDTPLPQGW